MTYFWSLNKPVVTLVLDFQPSWLSETGHPHTGLMRSDRGSENLRNEDLCSWSPEAASLRLNRFWSTDLVFTSRQINPKWLMCGKILRVNWCAQDKESFAVANQKWWNNRNRPIIQRGNYNLTVERQVHVRKFPSSLHGFVSLTSILWWLGFHWRSEGSCLLRKTQDFEPPLSWRE